MACECAALAIALACSGALLGAGRAAAAITPVTPDAAGAEALAGAIAAPGTNLTSASFETVSPTGTPNGTADAPFSFFPAGGQTFSILTTGDVRFADDPNDNVPDDPIEIDDKSANLGVPPTRGDTDFDVTILRLGLDVPEGANCLTIDLAFYSEEFSEFVGGAFNDAFIAELDSSSWTTAASAITAPDNFAFDQQGNPLSVNSSGSTAMSAANAAGTTYDGATPLLSASTQTTPGAHALYLSIFDQGDQVLDSAAFVDDLRVGFVPDPAQNCKPGAQPKQPPVTPSPPTSPPPTPRPPTGPPRATPPPAKPAFPCGTIDERATILGTGRDDVIVGTPGRDVIAGGPGDDVIRALGGDDVICGHGGEDRVRGAAGEDTIRGGKRADRISGGVGEDSVRGQTGRDRLDGGSDDDLLTGNRGAGSLKGKSGADELKAGRGDDRLVAGPGADRLSGGRGENRCRAGRADRLRSCDR